MVLRSSGARSSRAEDEDGDGAAPSSGISVFFVILRRLSLRETADAKKLKCLDVGFAKNLRVRERKSKI